MYFFTDLERNLLPVTLKVNGTFFLRNYREENRMTRYPKSFWWSISIRFVELL
jgi:hypothetical protein